MFTESPHVWVCVCVWIISLNLISLSQKGASASPMTNVTSDTGAVTDERGGGARAEGGGGQAGVELQSVRGSDWGMGAGKVFSYV